MFSGTLNGNYLPGTLASTRCASWDRGWNGSDLSQMEVDAMLADLRSTVTASNISASALIFDVSVGTSSPPSAAGLVDKNYLTSLGAVIATN